jgi:hypothetical protein
VAPGLTALDYPELNLVRSADRVLISIDEALRTCRDTQARRHLIFARAEIIRLGLSLAAKETPNDQKRTGHQGR